MPSLVLGSSLAFFLIRSLQKLSLQACAKSKGRSKAQTHCLALEGFVVSSAERLASRSPSCVNNLG